MVSVLDNLFNVDYDFSLILTHSVSKFQKYFYRFAFFEKPIFDENDEIVCQHLTFKDFQSPFDMLHVELQVNDHWLAFIKHSKYDTFNFQLNKYKEDVINIDYELSYLIVHGSCYEIIREKYMGRPPNGLQLIMGRRMLGHIDDSIVMQNMGYYQLKTDSPGLWYIDIKEGEFKDKYELENKRKRRILLFDHPYHSNFLPVNEKPEEDQV